MFCKIRKVSQLLFCALFDLKNAKKEGYGIEGVHFVTEHP